MIVSVSDIFFQEKKLRDVIGLQNNTRREKPAGIFVNQIARMVSLQVAESGMEFRKENVCHLWDCSSAAVIFPLMKR